MKKVFSAILAAAVIILYSANFASAAALPIKCSKFTYSFHNGTITQEFVIENVSNSKVYLYMDDFVFRKSGFNTEKPTHRGGGFSSRLDPPLYINSSYELYPGDVICAGLTYYTDDTTPVGWQFCYTGAGGIVVLATINE